MRVLNAHLTLLLGIWTSDALVGVTHPVVVSMEVTDSRLTKTTRQSLFCPLPLLEQAAQHGWGVGHSSTGERMVAFWPELLPAYLEFALVGADVDPGEMAAIVGASGLLGDEDEEPVERVRIQASVLARNRAFAGAVVAAYGGECAMCGLGVGLVEAAHIHPVAARDSSDAVWNGLCLCPNHHTAFDRHLVWVGPKSRRLELHPSIRAAADAGSRACDSLVRSTFTHLREPIFEADRPRAEMFEKRHEFFEGAYVWAAPGG